MLFGFRRSHPQRFLSGMNNSQHFSFTVEMTNIVAHISDAWSMNVAKVMSRWDNPPQSCVLRVIWTWWSKGKRNSVILVM